ncbi:hypothetical protein NDU88_001307 [Pleurodeles waltl]|uniref:Uncharacterized protein n=1 Tax=Pleurodeles waltl TaxID=8319 RepID=A0AAV7LAL3_PLEWA|nr:hypothetical protein NDU88_001307 [Pleurodeles waltl]
MDVWSHQYPTIPNYTHYSTVHDLHTCIDYWLSLWQFVSQIQVCEILPHTYTDPSPILLGLDLCMPPPPALPWRFPLNSLLDEALTVELGRNIEEYFILNMGTVTKFATVWEAFKVYVHNVTTAKHVGVLRALCNSLSRLETEIADLESKLMEGKDDNLLSSIIDKLVEFQEVAQNEVMHRGKYAVVRVYGEGERPGTILAVLLRPYHENNVIMQIQDDTERVWSDAESTVGKFHDYNGDLYKLRLQYHEATPTDYLTWPCSVLQWSIGKC